MKSFKELDLVENKETRMKIWQNALKESKRSSLGIAIGLGCYSLILFGFYYVGKPLLLALFNWLKPSEAESHKILLLLAIAAAPFYYLMLELPPTIFLRSRIRQGIWRGMADAGYPICGTCGYSVKGQKGHKCSECGEWFSVEQVENWIGEPIEVPTVSDASNS
ncbi:MAG TPA: hypothetical protein PKN33_20415 [Phycisphaerae bacterium]|nr:hypothetical protein [Phycisphaerae bacterium]